MGINLVDTANLFFHFRSGDYFCSLCLAVIADYSFVVCNRGETEAARNKSGNRDQFYFFYSDNFLFRKKGFI